MQTVKLYLKNGKFTLLDEDDFILYGNFDWKQLGSDGPVYRHVVEPVAVRCPHCDEILRWRRPRRVEYLHRVIMGNPVGMEVHHGDEDKLNNRRSNLEVLPKADHTILHNRQKTQRAVSSSGYRGVVRLSDTKWRAQIGKSGVVIHLGHHDTAEEAAVVYDAAVIGIRGQGWFTNLIPNE